MNYIYLMRIRDSVERGKGSVRPQPELGRGWHTKRAGISSNL